METFRPLLRTSVGATLASASRLFLASSVFLVTAVQLSAAPSIPLSKLLLRDAKGEPITVAPADFTVVCFLGTECPLARLYGPRLQRLADEYANRNIEFLGVDSNVQDSPAEILKYAREHGVRFPIAKDADQSVADAFAAERTPEVFVLDGSGRVRYRGRIDDQYQPGVARSEPSQHDLRDALESLLSGTPVKRTQTAGVGCLITRIPSGPSTDSSEATVTFNADVAPILHQHCVECHREGEIGPFALTAYDEVVGWGQMILEVIDERRMPPWHADPQFGHFVGERRVPSEARDTIAAWLDQGMREGDPEDLPPTPHWNDGWHLSSEPDVELKMRDRPFVVPADGVIEYQYFVVDPGWEEDRWVRAAQVVPGDARVVHHVIVFVRPPDGSDTNGVGWLGAYVPGQRTVVLPPGHARRIPAGSKLIFQMHYTPNGRETRDLSRVGVWFADSEDVTHEVFTRVAIDHGFEIPPRAEEHPVHMSVRHFPPESRLLGATPHMHLRGKSFVLRARRRPGGTETLLHVPHYDFNWQHYYQFAEPLELDTVEALEMTTTFDNSDRNPFNPAPNDFVTWGDQTWEEMALAFFDIAKPRGAASHASPAEPSPDPQEVAARERAIKQDADAFFARMDSNGDGVIVRDETPVTFRRFGFRNMDHNDDGRLDRNEIEASAAQRQ